MALIVGCGSKKINSNDPCLTSYVGYGSQGLHFDPDEGWMQLCEALVCEAA